MTEAQQHSSHDTETLPELEAGIADIFARLREADAGNDNVAPIAGPVDERATFDLLGELDRLWHAGA